MCIKYLKQLFFHFERFIKLKLRSISPLSALSLSLSRSLCLPLSFSLSLWRLLCFCKIWPCCMKRVFVARTRIFIHTCCCCWRVVAVVAVVIAVVVVIAVAPWRRGEHLKKKKMHYAAFLHSETETQKKVQRWKSFIFGFQGAML